MKKLFGIVLSFLLLIGLSSCSSKTAGSNQDPKQTDTAAESEEESSIPQHIQKIFLDYQQIVKENDLNIEIQSFRVNETDNFFEFAVSAREEGMHWDNVNFYKNDNGKVEKSYHIYLNSEHPGYIRDFVKATLMITGTDEQEIQEKANTIINSYAEGSASEIVRSGEWYVFLSHNISLGSPDPELRVSHQSEVFPKINPDNYQPIDYEAASGILNKGKKFLLEATITEQGGYMSSNEYYEAEGTDGNRYVLLNPLDYLPIRYEVGKSYRFYGVRTGDDIPTLRLEAVENSDGTPIN